MAEQSSIKENVTPEPIKLQENKPSLQTIKVSKPKWDDPSRHDPSDAYERPIELTPGNIRTIPDMVQYLRDHPTADIEAKVLGLKEGERPKGLTLDKKGFLEAWNKNSNLKTFREGVDWFGTTDPISASGGGIGHDYTPMLGGPFSKQLYYSYDYLQMHSQAFFAINHDPILRTAIDIIINFVLGKGFRVDCKNSDGLVLWRSFEKANNLKFLMRTFFRELLVYGENMIWWLPDNKTEIRYKTPPQQAAKTGIIPRVRLQDPSSCWEIITFPEDIQSVLAYVMIYPTQYQIYSGVANDKPVPSTKFIYQQIPAEQMDHYKINCMSNEKRGRSVLFPVLGYSKRLRDSVNYSIISLQKQSAWSIDTAIDGNQQDIDNYWSAIQSQGQFAPPGSEFVHSTKVERTFLGSPGGKGGQSDAFTWALDMVAAGLGIPVSYFGTAAGGSTSTRAGALVATEPVAKKMEEYQAYLDNVLQDMASRLFKSFGIEAEIEVTFPEIITQDRSSKLKDLSMAESMKWISHSRAAEIASKELNITNFDWDIEKEEIEMEQNSPDAAEYMPLTAPAQVPGSTVQQPKNDSSTAVTSDEKRDIKRAATT